MSLPFSIRLCVWFRLSGTQWLERPLDDTKARALGITTSLSRRWLREPQPTLCIRIEEKARAFARALDLDFAFDVAFGVQRSQSSIVSATLDVVGLPQHVQQSRKGQLKTSLGLGLGAKALGNRLVFLYFFAYWALEHECSLLSGNRTEELTFK